MNDVTIISEGCNHAVRVRFEGTEEVHRIQGTLDTEIRRNGKRPLLPSFQMTSQYTPVCKPAAVHINKECPLVETLFSLRDVCCLLIESVSSFCVWVCVGFWNEYLLSVAVGPGTVRAVLFEHTYSSTIAQRT
jgi:hypothetical protein